MEGSWSQFVIEFLREELQRFKHTRRAKEDNDIIQALVMNVHS